VYSVRRKNCSGKKCDIEIPGSLADASSMVEKTDF
jgi:hypothetical protein